MTPLKLRRPLALPAFLDPAVSVVAAPAHGLRPAYLIVLSSLWMALIGNLPLWRELHVLGLLASGMQWIFATALMLIIAACLATLQSLLAWRYSLKPAMALLLLASALGAYFMGTYHVVIDSTMLTNVLQTDAHEARDLLSLDFLVAFSLLGVVPALWVARVPLLWPARPRQALGNLLMAVTCLLLAVLVVMLTFQPLASTMRNHKHLRYMINPLNTLYAVGQGASQPWRSDHKTLLALGADATLATAGSQPPALLVLVLGETARSGNFSVNGYARETTPQLAREQVASFHNAWSCGTSTAASLPCMFSHLTRAGFDSRSHNHETLLDVLQHAGLAVLWIDNQSGCKGVCDRVPSVSTAQLAHPSLCPGGECLDGVMLDGLDERIAALPAERRARGVVLVMHQMGSHGPAYSKRSPAAFKRFMPECASINLQDCSRSELVNAYDNSIAYTDYFLASTIGWLKQKQAAYATAMLYVSDHGESLGEHNLYLHGMPYSIAPDVQKHVPWITWLSPTFERRGLAMECLQKQQNTLLSHDNYFHSVLGLMQVKTSVYQRNLDAYALCAGA